MQRNILVNKYTLGTSIRIKTISTYYKMISKYKGKDFKKVVGAMSANLIADPLRNNLSRYTCYDIHYYVDTPTLVITLQNSYDLVVTISDILNPSQPKIIVDETFITDFFNHRERYGILLHEMGRINSKTRVPKYTACKTVEDLYHTGVINPTTLEADEYCLNEMGEDYIDSLLALRRFNCAKYSISEDNVGNIELNARIEILKAKIKNCNNES